MDRADALAADATDPLAPLRHRFLLPEGIVYLDGNSLGALQPAVADRLREVVDHEWGAGLIRSWDAAGWVELPRRIARRLGPLLGADPDELAVTDSTSVNVFKALVAGRQLVPDRRIVLTDDGNFPTDVYVAHGLAELTGDLEVRVVESERVADHLDADVAVLLLTHVDYRTARIHDARDLTAAAHAVGAVTVWDLAHSAGALEVDLHGWDADLAVGCGYKYLNGGPGAPAFLYAARRWHDRLGSAVRGWFGHAEPFAFASGYVPAAGANRFLDGTPPVLSMAALETALEVWDEVDLPTAAAKARDLTARFISLVDQRIGARVEVVTPRDPARRGAHVSLRHPRAAELTRALVARGVIVDHRPPDLVRFGFAPLYVTHVDVWEAVDRLADLLANDEGQPPPARTTPPSRPRPSR